MKDFTTERFAHWSELMRTGAFYGQDRPITRVTWQKRIVKGATTNRPGPWRDLLFHDAGITPEKEFSQNVKTVQIDKSIGQDAATCSIVLLNYHGTSLEPEGLDEYGREGYLTFNRGTTNRALRPSIYKDASTSGSDLQEPLDEGGYPTTWEYPENLYRDVFIPNTIIRTYSGYGSDNFDEYGNLKNVHDYDGAPSPPWKGLPYSEYVEPKDDTKLELTGTWLIDKVTYGADGTIRLDCRDLAKLLIEQYVYPPMIPLTRFPLIYCPATAATGSSEQVGKQAGVFSGSSVDPWYGHNASLYGHKGTDAFDGRPDSYWLSVGNASPNSGYSFEWIQADCGGDDVNEIVFSTVGGNYTVYVSVYEAGAWRGGNTVPYDPNNPASFPNGSNIPYVMMVTSGASGQSQTIKLDRTYKAKYVRLCFTNLWDSGLGTYQYRAAVREFVVRYHKANDYVPSTIGKPGYIQDWSEAVKELCGWGGLTWYDSTPAPADYLLGNEKSTGKPLRVWGDFEVLGAGPVVCTPGDFFMNKSFMDAIRTIVDFLGCIFFIDETGGAIFRLPNVFSGGNFINDPTKMVTIDTSTNKPIGDAYYNRLWPVEYHENANLISYSVVIDDSNVRSEVLVVGDSPDTNSTNPVAGGYVLGTDPSDGSASAVNLKNVLAGQNRLFLVPGDATKGFTKVEECQRMAELIALFILFSYRKGQLTAPWHPALELDDQIRIFERVTNEVHVHYVSGISTTWDLESGSSISTITCHWLGEDPDSNWFLDSILLTPAVKQLPSVINRLGTVTG